MKRKWLVIGISTVSVILFILTSLSNVIGYQTVQSSNQSVIKERINQKELLFQTIVDIANNKEIQRIFLKSQMRSGMFPTSEFPVVTKTHIRQMYFLGLILSKFISKSKIQSVIGKYRFNNQEISSVIEKDTTINSEITLLKNSECDCETEKEINWTFPVLCTILFFIFLPLLILGLSIEVSGFIIVITLLIWMYKYGIDERLFWLSFLIVFLGEGVLTVPEIIGDNLNCWWTYSD